MYAVEKTILIEESGSLHAGGIGIKHTVNVRQVNQHDDEDPDPNKSILRLSALFFEVDKWWVSVKSKSEATES